MDRAEIESVGRLIAVEDGRAHIEWTMRIELDIDDLPETFRAIAGPDVFPEICGEGRAEVRIEVRGEGEFDPSVCQLVQTKFEGTYSVETEATVRSGEREGHARTTFSGTIEAHTKTVVVP